MERCAEADSYGRGGVVRDEEDGGELQDDGSRSTLEKTAQKIDEASARRMMMRANLPLSTPASVLVRLRHCDARLRAQQFENIGTLALISSSPNVRSGAIASRAVEPRLAASARRPLRLRGHSARSGVAARVVARRSVRSRACAMGSPRLVSAPSPGVAPRVRALVVLLRVRGAPPELVLDASLPPDANAPALVYDEGRDAPLALTTGDLDAPAASRSFARSCA